MLMNTLRKFIKMQCLFLCLKGVLRGSVFYTALSHVNVCNDVA